MRIFFSISIQSRNFQDIVFRGLSETLSRNQQTVEMIYPRAGSKLVEPDELKKLLESAELVVADLSEGNDSVRWEIGYAQARGIPVVLLAQDASDIPVELRSEQVILYNSSVTPGYLISRVIEKINSILALKSPPPLEAIVPIPHKIFISYSHMDSQYLQRILIHLRPLERKGYIDPWSDRNLRPGQEWREKIKEALDAARVAVLLISADFLASEFIVTNELPPLLEAAQEKGTNIIPIIIKPSRFVRDKSLSKFLALNDPRESVIGMSEVDREKLYAKLAEDIEIDLGEIV